MCLEKESPQHQRQGNNCHIDADAISTLTCCLRKASALVQMHPPIPPLPSLKVSRQRSHPSRNAAALVGPVSMSINATLTCCSEGITRTWPHFCDIFIFINIDEQKSRVDTCMYLANLEREIPPRCQGIVMYWCFSVYC